MIEADMYSTVVKWLTLIVLLIVTVVFSINYQAVPIRDTLTFEKVAGALGGIFIIVLLVERVTEIIITIWRQSDADSLKAEIEVLEKDKNASITDARKRFATYQAETKSIALLVAFAISILICSAGIGLLGTIVDVEKGSRSFLRGIDIVLTSGLIAGGSDNFHKFVSAFDAFFTETRKRLEKENKP